MWLRGGVDREEIFEEGMRKPNWKPSSTRDLLSYPDKYDLRRSMFTGVGRLATVLVVFVAGVIDCSAVDFGMTLTFTPAAGVVSVTPVAEVTAAEVKVPADGVSKKGLLRLRGNVIQDICADLFPRQ